MTGFHGCDASTLTAVLAGETNLRPSTNRYDWLGHGIYFWEGSPKSALSYAKGIQSQPHRGRGLITKPAVLGAILDLGRCLDLTDPMSLGIVKDAYLRLTKIAEKYNFSLPKNFSPVGSDVDNVLRELDCAVFSSLHVYYEEIGVKGFDAIRAPFLEGKPIYPGLGFREKTHIQICIRNPHCIQGYFNALDPLNLEYYKLSEY